MGDIEEAGSPGVRRLLLGLLILVIAADRLGAAFAPWLATHHPLLLVGADPTDKAIVLALRVSVGVLIPVALVRRLLGQSLYFLIGRRLGPEARRFLSRRGLERTLARIERLFRRWSYVVVFLAPRDVVCVLAGDTGVGWKPFLLLVTARDLTAIVLLRLLSEAFAAQVQRILGLLNTYAVPATAVTVALASVPLLRQRHRRRQEARRRVLIAAGTAEHPPAADGSGGIPAGTGLGSDREDQP